MALTVQGLWGGAYNTVSDLAITWTAGGPSGGWMVAFVGCNNLSLTDLPSSSQILAVTEVNGNVVFQKAGEWTNAQAAAGGGATSAIFYGTWQGAATSSARMVVSFAALTTGRCVEAIWGIMGAGSALTLGGIAVNSTDAGSVSALTIASLPSREYLFAACLTGEETTGASFAESANYTSGSRRGAGTNAAAAIGMRQAYRVLTGTTDTYDPATIVTDWSTVYVAFWEKQPAVSLTTGLDAALLKALTTTTTIDAALKKALTLALGADAVLARTMQATLGIDTLLQGTGNLSTGLQAVLQKQFALQSSIEAALRKTLSLNLNIDATLQEQLALQASIDAILAQEVMIECGLDAQLIALALMARTLVMDALLTGTWRTSAATSGTWAAATPAT